MSKLENKCGGEDDSCLKGVLGAPPRLSARSGPVSSSLFHFLRPWPQFPASSSDPVPRPQAHLFLCISCQIGHPFAGPFLSLLLAPTSLPPVSIFSCREVTAHWCPLGSACDPFSSMSLTPSPTGHWLNLTDSVSYVTYSLPPQQATLRPPQCS